MLYMQLLLEFCEALEEVLEFIKAQAESLLGDLTRQPSGRPASIVRFQTKLLSLIQDMEIGDEIWFEDLSTCFSQSQFLPKELPSDLFSRGVDGYDSLDFSQKLRVLSFLCDKALGTESMRSRRKVSAAKSKEKNHKQKLKGEVAKAITAGNNAASTSDHESIVSRLKSEAAQAHAELLEAQALVQKMKQRSDAFRTQPYLLDADGRAFWKLKGYNNEGDDVLLQEMGTWDALASSDEKWFLYGAETKEAVEKYCSSVRTNRRRTRSMSQTLPSSSGSKEEDILQSASPGSKEEDILKIADD
ncbi:hypothetical protein M0R45_032819 [Rubus argutus]|uniref:DDT domain-containing protein n=1 Tax=Rubus argutus TaxID=59490 RepID=A0AAW1WMA3_RUBAR